MSCYHQTGECEECGETRILTQTIWGNVCQRCEEIMEEIEEECNDE